MRGILLDIETKKDANSVARQGAESAQKNIIQCECDYRYEEGGKVRPVPLVLRPSLPILCSSGQIQCYCCDTWQHNHCYGFVFREPWKYHVCYQCLFGTRHKDRLNEMRELAEFRRALWLLYEKEPKNRHSFAENLGESRHDSRLRHILTVTGLDQKATSKLVDRLKREGFLPKSRGTRIMEPVKSGTSSSSKLSYLF